MEIRADVPAELIAERIKGLQETMRSEGLDGFLLTQNIDIYYFCGSMQNGYLFVPCEGQPAFYVKRSLWRAEKEASVPVQPLGSFKAFGQRLRDDFPSLFGAARPVRIGADLDVLPASTYMKLTQLIAAGDGACSLIDGSGAIRRMRMVKSAWEIERIEAAAAAVAEALEAALPALQEGVTELAWMARVEYELRIRGHIGLMRLRGYNQEIATGMIMAGASAAVPSCFDGPAGGLGLGSAFPQNVSRRPIGRNEPILIDLGCCIDGYIIDQTRTAVIGQLPDELQRAYGVAESILRQAEQSMLPGAIPADIYNAAVKLSEAEGLRRHFMGYGADQAKFLGHGIGLELDEWPVLAEGFLMKLAEGMVLAVEPKFTLPGQGVVGIENSYLVTDKGASALTKFRDGLIVL